MQAPEQILISTAINKYPLRFGTPVPIENPTIEKSKTTDEFVKN